jgi:hypothetical protein
LKGEVTLVRKNIGKIANLSEENTLGEEVILDRRFKTRKESAFVEGSIAYLIEITADKFFKIKELLYEIGLKKDFLMLESILRRNFMQKKSLRL